MFPQLGLMEMIVVMGVAVLLFGKRLPEVGRSLGKGIIEFKKGLRGIEGSSISLDYLDQPPRAGRPPTRSLRRLVNFGATTPRRRSRSSSRPAPPRPRCRTWSTRHRRRTRLRMTCRSMLEDDFFTRIDPVMKAAAPFPRSGRSIGRRRWTSCGITVEGCGCTGCRSWAGA